VGDGVVHLAGESRGRKTGSNPMRYRSTTRLVWPASVRPAVNSSRTAWQSDAGWGCAYTVRTFMVPLPFGGPAPYGTDAGRSRGRWLDGAGNGDRPAA
jgi:hypothetical protein